MNTVFNTIQHLSVIVVAAYLLARTSLMQPGQNTGKRLGVTGLFSCIVLYSVGAQMLSGGSGNTQNVGVTLGGLLFGSGVGLAVAGVSAAASLLRGSLTAVPDILIALLSGWFCGWYCKRVAKMDAVLAGIVVGTLEMIHMLLIVAWVQPVETAKAFVYTNGFSMIILNGCGVVLFFLLLEDMEARRTLGQKQAMLQSELRVAADIQTALLDTAFDVDPRCDLRARLTPANEVGGDLYSFIQKGDDLYFFLGDVSGKGVPAAITMSRTVALFQTYARLLDDPGEIFSIINDNLARNNASSMFVTAVMGRLSLSDGQLCYVNAGHTPFYLADNRKVEELVKPRGMALGVMGGRTYTPQTVQLKEGQFAIFYTDGVSEGENLKLEQFGAERIVAALAKANQTSDGLCEGLYSAVKAFADGYPQSDDIAILVLGWQNPNRDMALNCKNSREDVALLLDRMHEKLKAPGMDQELGNAVCLVCEEVLTNIVSYGYPDGRKGNLSVGVRLASPFALLQIQDDSDPFDPLGAQKPTFSKNAMERPVGGLGVFVSRNRVMRHCYVTKNGQNTWAAEIVPAKKKGVAAWEK